MFGTNETAPELLKEPPFEAAMVYGPSTTDQIGLDEYPDVFPAWAARKL